MMLIEKYSFGIGDRFGKQAKAQLRALIQAEREGISVVPVWNKSNREHTTIKSTPASVKQAADEAIGALGWTDSYYIDADHIGLNTVDRFLESSNFFTIDVADFIGQEADAGDIEKFIQQCQGYLGELKIPGIDETFAITKDNLSKIAGKFLTAVKEAGRVYDYIESAKGKGNFVTEISMDETDEPQTPVELFFILAAIAARQIPVQTIAPKFTGRFNKGVEYVGDVNKFSTEFEQDILVLRFAVSEFGLPENLKLSVHSGSDKFSIYPVINRLIKKHTAGLHLKTAGTTWLEELIGLATAGGDGLEIAKTIYKNAYARLNELCKPYENVIDIDHLRLPQPSTVDGWSGKHYAETLRHDQSCETYNPHFRQLLHLSYKIAAELGQEYLGALDKYESTVAENVTENIFERHIKPIFG
jgi:hypothetical protein